jgi:hypothetical protein
VDCAQYKFGIAMIGGNRGAPTGERRTATQHHGGSWRARISA